MLLNRIGGMRGCQPVYEGFTQHVPRLIEARTQSIKPVIQTAGDINLHNRNAHWYGSEYSLKVPQQYFSSLQSPWSSVEAPNFVMVGYQPINEDTHHATIRDNIKELQEDIQLQSLLFAFKECKGMNANRQIQLCGESFILSVLSSSHGVDRGLLVAWLFKLGFEVNGRECLGEFVFDMALNKTENKEEALSVVAALVSNGYSLDTADVYGRPIGQRLHYDYHQIPKDMDELRGLLSEYQAKNISRLVAYGCVKLLT
jgi:hypothetical protein